MPENKPTTSASASKATAGNSANPPSKGLTAAEILQLEDSSEGSTQPVAAASGSPTSVNGQKIEPLKVPLPDTTNGESSTAGFDTMLGALVVEAGLVTRDEMELCNSLMRETNPSEDPRTLPDLLLEQDFVTPRQLQRLRNEFEAKKSTQRIPGYRILRKIGQGAMATVFLAKQLSLDRDVAIKVLPKKFSQNAKFIERFYKEGKAAAQLNHPNIVAAYDVGQAGEHHYFVMEYVDGLTVFDKLVREKRVDEQTAIRNMIQTAKALQHAHARGFVHRDIKPKNIMYTLSGIVKLADLGLARAMSDKEAAKAEAGRAYGTPYYISPEQIRGEVNIGPPADIYGLGATFYHMVTGRVPFEGKNPSAVMHQHLKAELIPPDHLNPKISNGTASVIEMMMAKNPAERYQNATDLLTDLELIAQGLAPHFAHKSFDLSGVATAIANEVPTQPVVVQPVKQKADGVNPLMMVAFVMLGLSLIANLVMIVLLAT